MGNSGSKQDYPTSGGGGIFACCSSSAAEVVDHPQMNLFQTRRIATARSPNESSDEGEGDEIGADIIETAPLEQTSLNGSKTYGSFNLKEQMRLDAAQGDFQQDGNGFVALGMSFAQRKFIGFRCKYEYDAKAVLIYSRRQIFVLTYTMESMGDSNFADLVDHRRGNFLNPENSSQGTSEDSQYEESQQEEFKT